MFKIFFNNTLDPAITESGICPFYAKYGIFSPEVFKMMRCMLTAFIFPAIFFFLRSAVRSNYNMLIKNGLAILTAIILARIPVACENDLKDMLLPHHP
jgi:hypothetical protein